MGAYLSSPITTKETEEDEDTYIRVASASMQGWRMSQEDAHNAILDFDTNSSLFAVYDGHGGHEVAVYTAKHLPDFIKKNSLYLKGQMNKALVESFVEFDRTITSPEVVAELRKIVGNKNDDEEEERDPQELSHLCEEASMPIEDVLTKYVTGADGGGAGEEGEASADGVEAESNSSSSEKKEAEAAEAAAGGSSSSSSSAKKPPANRAVAALQKAGGSKPISPYLRGKSNAAATTAKTSDKKEDDDGAKQTLDFKEEEEATAAAAAAGETNGDEEGSKDKEEAQVKKEEKEEETKQEKENGEEEAPALTKVKAKDTDDDEPGDTKDTNLVNGTTNGHHESKEAEAVTTNGSTDIKGKGKGKGKGKSSSVVGNKQAKGEEGEGEEEESSSPVAPVVKKSSPKKSAEELYKGLLSSECPEDDELDDDDDDDDSDDSDDEDGGGFGPGGANDDGSETEDTDDQEDTEDDSEDEDGFEGDGFMCGGGGGSGRDYAEMPGNDSGCTAVVAVLRGTTLYVANAGDSRCVVCRDGQAVEMSFDHKPEDEPEMKRIEAAGGKVTPDGRVNGGLNLSRAIGDHTYKTNKSLPLQEQMISPVPDVRTLQLDAKRDSFILLACDGIWNSLSSQETVDFVQQRLLKLENEAKKDPSTQQLTKICEELFDYCLAPDTVGDGTGCDNMTAVLVKLRPAFENKPEVEEEEEQQPAETAAAATTDNDSSATTAATPEVDTTGAASSSKKSEEEGTSSTTTSSTSKKEEGEGNSCGSSSSNKREATAAAEDTAADEQQHPAKKLKVDDAAEAAAAEAAEEDTSSSSKDQKPPSPESS